MRLQRGGVYSATTRLNSKGGPLLYIPLTRVFMFKSAAVLLVVLLAACAMFAGHRESPGSALDPVANISDVYAFRSYAPGSTDRVTLIICVDPMLEPAVTVAGHPFDPDILYEIKIDNNNDAVPDVIFQFRFVTEQRLPNLYQVYVGAGGGITAPANSPAPVPPGTLIVPPRITSFGDPGLGLRQSYTINMIKGGILTTLPNSTGGSSFAVPPNVGPRTMDYNALFNAGTYTATVGSSSIKMFAGTVDDPFWVDAGGLNDTLNTHKSPPVLSPAEDATFANLAADTYSGYSVNAIAIEVPISMLTSTGALEPATSTAATLGIWATTSRPRSTTRRSPLPPVSTSTFLQT